MKYFLMIYSFMILSVPAFAATYDCTPGEFKKGEIFQEGVRLTVDGGTVTITPRGIINANWIDHGDVGIEWNTSFRSIYAYTNHRTGHYDKKVYATYRVKAPTIEPKEKWLEGMLLVGVKLELFGTKSADQSKPSLRIQLREYGHGFYDMNDGPAILGSSDLFCE